MTGTAARTMLMAVCLTGLFAGRAAAEGMSGFTLDNVRERFNVAARVLGAPTPLRLRSGDCRTKSRTVCVFPVNDNLGAMAVSSREGGPLDEFTVMHVHKGTAEMLNTLTLFGVAIAILDPKLDTDARGPILTRMLKAGLNDKVVVEGKDVRYEASRSEEIGLHLKIVPK